MKNRSFRLSSAIGWLLGLLCALVLGGVFYGAMAYQLLGQEWENLETACVADKDALLALPDMELISEQTVQQEVGGETCTVTTRIYQTQDGVQVEAVSASPAAYIERLSQEKWTPQLITGYVLAGMEAVYSLRGEEKLLCARTDDRIFMLCTRADEQMLYTLGAQAALE